MKPMSKKAQMICSLPAVIIGGAVMIYCFATNIAGNKPLIYGIAAMIIVWLLMYLFVGKKMQAQEAAQEEKKPEAPVKASAPAPAAPAPAKATGSDSLNLQSLLTAEELKILLSDLQVASDHAPADQKAAFTSLATEISRTGSLKPENLSVCVYAVETGLGVFSAFGIVPAGHSNLLEKLKKLTEEK